MSTGGGLTTPTGQDHGNRWTLALGIALGLFVAGRCLVPMDETDLFYNLRLGEIILGTNRVPRTNLLSFTYPDTPDPNLAWIFQVLLALVHRAGGIPATVVLKTAFVVGTFALLFAVALRRGAHPAIAAAVLALSAWAAEPRFVERPHLVTFLGLGTLLLALERAECGKPRLLWTLIPLGLVWANGNSCFFLAPTVLLLYAAGALLDRAPTQARRAGCVALALCPLLFATPSGGAWMGYVANHFRMPSLRPLQEYRTAEWPVDGPFFFLLLAVLLVTVLPVERPTGQTTRPGLARHLMPIAALALLGSRRIRFVAEFALLSGPYVAARSTRLGARFLRRLDGRESTPSSRSSKPRAGGLSSAVIATGLALLTLGPRLRAIRAGEPFLYIGIEDNLVPWTAIRWLDAHQLRDHLYNDLEVGSVLAWDGWPRHRVFQDPRINAYPAEFHALLRRPDLDRTTWEAFQLRFATTAALITYPDVNPRAGLFDPDLWALVYRTNEALVFVRRDQAHAALIDSEELPLTFRFDAVKGVDPIPLDMKPATSPLAVCEWQRRLGDLYVARQDAKRAAAAYRNALTGGVDCLAPATRETTRVAAATLALRSGESQRAAELLEGLPTPGAKINRGFALVALGRIAEGLAEFDEALRQGSDDAEAGFGRALALTRLDRRDDAIVALRAFLRRWPEHFAAPEARSLLDRLAR